MPSVGSAKNRRSPELVGPRPVNGTRHYAELSPPSAMQPHRQALAAVVSSYRSGCTRLAHQVENGLAVHYHQTGSVMIASASPPKKELMQKNIRMSSTLVMTRPLWIRRDHGGAKGPSCNRLSATGLAGPYAQR